MLLGSTHKCGHPGAKIWCEQVQSSTVTIFLFGLTSMQVFIIQTNSQWATNY